MIKQIERQIRDLKRDLIQVRRERTSLRLQPCKGDMELRRKEGKLEELDERTRTFRESIRELERKRQEVLSEPFNKEGCQSPFS
jgi:chromosome segregation ATPase